MKNLDERLLDAGADTLAVRAGQHRSSEGEQCEPIFTTSSYVFSSAEEAAARFSGEADGNVYSRYTNPTVRAFEERMAALEGAEAAVATASGMAAILSTCMALLQAGDHILCSNAVFGSTIVLLTKHLSRFGVAVDFVSSEEVEDWQAAIRPNTRMLFLETPSNPLCRITDVAQLATLAKQHNALLVVDNSFCTPALQRPLNLGADIVLYAATKYIDGQGRCLGGVVLGSKDIVAELNGFIRSAGPSLAPFNAWVFLKGLETLRLRMIAHSQNAAQIATWLAAHDRVAQVYYCGLEGHPNHAIAKRQQRDFGGVLSFEIRCADTAQYRNCAWRFIDQVKLMSHTANLGDAKTTIVHPASTTHGRLSEEQRQAAGIQQNLVRIAVGLEDPGDIINDIERGFAAL